MGAPYECIGAAPFECIDVLDQVLDEMTDELGTGWVVDKSQYDNIVKFCDGIDSILDRFSGVGLSAEVDQDKMIHITIETDDIVIRKGETQFYELMEYSTAIKFFSSEENNLCVEYTLKGIWEKKEA